MINNKFDPGSESAIVSTTFVGSHYNITTTRSRIQNWKKFYYGGKKWYSEMKAMKLCKKSYLYQTSVYLFYLFLFCVHHVKI